MYKLMHLAVLMFLFFFVVVVDTVLVHNFNVNWNVASQCFDFVFFFFCKYLCHFILKYVQLFLMSISLNHSFQTDLSMFRYL